MTKLQLLTNAFVVAFAFTLGDGAWYMLNGFKWNPIASFSAAAAIVLLTFALWGYTT